MELLTVTIVKPEATNFILGQTHFIKSVEDLHEAMVGVSGSLRFGLAFCEASGPRLVRHSGNDPELVELATAALKSAPDVEFRLIAGGLAEGIAGWAEVGEFVLRLRLSGERGRYPYQDQQGFG